MKRQNRIGMLFDISEETPSTTRIAFKDKHIVVNMSLDDVSKRWYLYEMRGISIQFAFDNLPPDQREFIITGITPDVWNEIFKETE